MNKQAAFLGHAFEGAVKPIMGGIERGVGRALPRIGEGATAHMAQEGTPGALMRQWGYKGPPGMRPPMPRQVPGYRGEVPQWGNEGMYPVNPVGNGAVNAMNREAIQFPYGLPLKQAAVFEMAFSRHLNTLCKEAMHKQAVEENFPMSALQMSGIGRGIDPSQQDRLHDRGFMNRMLRGNGRDALTALGGLLGAGAGGVAGAGVGAATAPGGMTDTGRAFVRLFGKEKIPEAERVLMKAMHRPALGLALGVLAGGLGGAYGGYQAGGGGPQPLGLMDKLRLATKSSGVVAASPMVEGAEAIGKKVMPNIFKRFGSAFGSGARDAEKDIFGHANPELPGLEEARRGLAERFGYGLGNTQIGAWAHSNPATAAGIGAGVGSLDVAKGYDSMRNSRREKAMAQAPFAQRLMMSLQYLTNPQGVASHLY